MDSPEQRSTSTASAFTFLQQVSAIVPRCLVPLCQTWPHGRKGLSSLVVMVAEEKVNK